MLNSPLAQNVITFLLRRAVTLLGAAVPAVSDEWYSQTAGILLVAANEAAQYWQSHKAAKKAGKL